MWGQAPRLFSGAQLRSARLAPRTAPAFTNLPAVISRAHVGIRFQAMNEQSTPLMRQYAAVKKEHPNALVFFRLGDFYEMFFEDAIVGARELQITLTSRNKEKGEKI